MTPLVSLTLIASTAVADLVSVPLIPVRVFNRVFVTMGTMCLCALAFACYSTTSGPNANSALQIDFPSDGFKVFRVNAAPHAAEMVEVQAFLDRTINQSVHNAMGEFGAVFAIGSLEANASVFTFVNLAQPQPAAIVGLRGNQIKHPLEDSTSGSSHGRILANRFGSNNSTFWAQVQRTSSV